MALEQNSAHCLFVQMKFYWNTSTTIYLLIICGYSWTNTAELNCCDGDPLSHKAKGIYYLTINRKFVIPYPSRFPLYEVYGAVMLFRILIFSLLL